MSGFDRDRFVTDLRSAAASPDAKERVRGIMEDAFQHPAALASAFADCEGDDVVLFEDDTVSIWYCRFNPTEHIPPHDHQTVATIGVYAGQEINHFYKREGERLVRASSKHLGPGDVIAMGPDAIHSVETEGAEPSYGVHVYLAPLTTIERSLVDWETGEASPMNEAAFKAAVRPSEA